jgi:parallel beta-helix repeat protein
MNMKLKVNALLVIVALTINCLLIVIEIAQPISAYIQHDPISVDGDLDFANQVASEGWVGNGSSEDPYIIEGYEINVSFGNSLFPNPIDIRSTKVHFIIKNSRISGDWYTSNINLFNVTNATIKDCIIKNGSLGLEISRGSNNKFINNTLINNDFLLWQTTNSNISENTFVNCGLIIEGNELEHWNTHRIDTSNTIGENPLYYLKNQNEGPVPSDLGQIILANCTNVIIENQELSKSSIGIILGYSSHNTIKNNVIYSQNQGGISLWHSSENEIAQNSITSSKQGIILEHSDNNTVQFNELLSNSDGIFLVHSNNNNIFQNNASSGSGTGIYCGSPSGHFPTYGNTISNNTITNNGFDGLHIEYAKSLTVFGNNISDNWIGISISLTNESIFHHNILIGNYDQLNRGQSSNLWQNGTGIGNYWSDYEGLDSDNDGVGDTNLPHQGVDYYPLMNPEGTYVSNNENKDNDDSDVDGSSSLCVVIILIIMFIVILLLMIVMRKIISSESNNETKENEDQED